MKQPMVGSCVKTRKEEGFPDDSGFSNHVKDLPHKS
jgi:hypothetical protein